MPWNTEELAKKFGQNAEEIKQNLEGLIGGAEDVDKAFKKMTDTMEASLEISNKFEKAMASSSKALALFGHSGVSAARGLKTIDAVSRSTATSLGSIGVGAASAVAGFKALASGAASFATDIGNAERSIAGLMSGIGGLESKISGISTSNVPINVVVGSLKALDDLEQRIKALPKEVTINFGGAGTKAMMPAIKVPAGAGALPTAAVYPAKAKAKGNKSAFVLAKEMVKTYATTFSKRMSSSIELMRGKMEDLEDEFAKTGKSSGDLVPIAKMVAQKEKVTDFLEKIKEGTDEDRRAWMRFHIQVKKDNGDMTRALENLKKKYVDLGPAIERAERRAGEAAEEATSQMKYLENQMNKESKTLGDLFQKTFATGAMEASNFANGLGKNATGMLAVGVAGAFLAKKLGEVAVQFAESALGLARYKTETAALEETISGISKGGLDQMRKQLSMTRDQAKDFFVVVKKGANEMGMSQAQIMDVAKALRDTFGGDQTERLKEYIGLLEMIPTIETDIKITASMDDQASAIFALAEAGKMSVVMDLQGAGLLGGEKEKKPGADMANAAQKTAAITEGIHDFLLGKMYPEFGQYLSGIAEASAGVISVVMASVAALGGLSLLTGTASADNLISRAVATGEIVAAIESSAALGSVSPRKMPGVGAGGGMASLGKTALKLGKGLAIVTVATLALEGGFYLLEKHFEKTGSVVGAAGASIGKSAASIAGFAAAGAVIGSVFPGLGTAIGAVAGAAVGLVVEFGNLRKSFSTLYDTYFGKRDTPSSKALSENEEKQNRVTSNLVKSGLELERTLKKIDQAANNAKNSFYKMQKDLADLKIENLQEIGGSATAFGSAVKGAATATRKQYEMQTRDFASIRQGIMKNGKMDAASRRAALDVLHKEELTATKNFVEAMNTVVEALFKTPGIIQAGLKAEIAGTMLEFADIGGMGAAPTQGFEQEQAKAAQEVLDRVINAATESAETTARTVEALNKKRVEREKEIGDLVAEADKKRISGIEDVALAETKKRLEEAKAAAEEARKPSVGGAVGVSAALAVGGAPAAILAQNRLMENQQAEIRKADARVADLYGAVNVELARQLEEVKTANRIRSVTYKEVKKNEKGEKVTVTKVDVNKAASVLEKVVSESEKLDEEMAAARTEMLKSFGAGQAKAARDIATRMEEAKKRAQTANTEYQKAVKSKGDVGGKAGTEKEAADKAVADLEKQMMDVSEQMTTQIKGLAPKLDDAAIKEVVNTILTTKGSLGDMEAGLAKYPEVWKAIQESIVKNSEAIQKLDVMNVQKDALEKQKGYLEGIVEIESGITLAYKNTAKGAGEILAATKEAIANQTARVGRFTEEVHQAQRAANVSRRVADAEGTVSDGIEAQRKASEDQVELVKKQVKNYEDTARSIEAGLPTLEAALPKVKKAREDMEKMYAQIPEGTDIVSKNAKAEAKAKLDSALAAEASVEAQISASKRNADAAWQNAANAKEALGQAGKMIEDAFTALDKSVTGIRLKNFEEYAQVLADTADYAGTVADAAKNSFEVAKATANERYQLEKRAAEEGLAADRKTNEERLRNYMSSEEMMKVTDPAARAAAEAAAKAELEATTQSKYRLESAKAEVKQKRAVVDAAKQSKELKEREIDMQQGLIDDAMSFASDFGGSFSSLMALQQMNVSMARQQLDAAKAYRDELVAAGVEGLALQEAQYDVIHKQLAVRRKELGVQKDMMERMLGAAFGELRTEFGARRQVGSDQALMGVAATRMKTAGGMFVDVPGGAPGTIQERANQRMFGRAGTPEAEGVLGDVMKALKKTPTKSPLEAELAKAAGATANNTDKTANATGEMRDAATSRGSLFTHDEGAQTYLGSILAVLKEMAVGLLGGATGMGVGGQQGASKDSKEIRAVLQQAISEATSEAVKSAEKTEKGLYSLKQAAEKTTENTAGSDGNLTKNLQIARKEMRNSMVELKLAKKGSKEQEKAGEVAKKNLDKVAGLEAAVRTRENLNPLAGAAPGIEDYERVMAGKLPEEAKEFSEIMGKGTKEATKTAQLGTKERKATGQAAVGAARYLQGGKFDQSAKALGGSKFDPFGKTLGGGKFDPFSKTLGSTAPAITKTLKDQQRISRAAVSKGWGGTAGGVTAVGGTSIPKGATSPMGARGMGVTRGGVSNPASSETMAGKAAGTAVVPPTVGAQVAARGGGGGVGGGASTEGMTCKVTGEMLVKFDNKVFKDQIAQVVGSLIKTPEIAKAIQGVAFR